MFKGKILIAGLTIDEYGIERDSELRISARLPGGMRILIKNSTGKKKTHDSEQPL